MREHATFCRVGSTLYAQLRGTTSLKKLDLQVPKQMTAKVRTMKPQIYFDNIHFRSINHEKRHSKYKQARWQPP